MQNRLTGLSRQWYNNLKNYNMNWKEWKVLLTRSFPDHHDFASTLRKLLTRTKQSNENWEKYYFDKMDKLTG